jgi:hypothetical protein
VPTSGAWFPRRAGDSLTLSGGAVLLAKFGSSDGERDVQRACCVLNQLHGFPDGLSLRTIIEVAAVPRCGGPGAGCLVQGPAIRRELV